MKPFVVTASDISAIANHHKYKDWQSALTDTLERYNQVAKTPPPPPPPPKASASILEDLRTYSDLGDVDTTDVLLEETVVIDGCPVVVTGRTNGRTRKGGAVVEIKNRKNGFFEPDYDLDQLATYVVLTKADEGILVQNHEDALKINRYTREEMTARWERLLRDLKPAVQQFKKKTMIKQQHQDHEATTKALLCQLSQKDKALKKLEKERVLFSTFIHKIALRQRNEWIYIATTKPYAKQKLFKVGSAEKLSKRLLQGYRTAGHMYYCWTYQVYDAKKIDSLIKYTLSDFRKELQHDMYQLHFPHLVELVQKACDHYNSYVEYVNDFKRHKLTQSLAAKSVEITPAAAPPLM